MPEITYRLDPSGRLPDPPPDATAALERLREGNDRFQALFEERQVVHVPPHAFGISPDGSPIPQRPFAAFLGCADARAPIEMIFGCSSNELFVVRVAGNVPGFECMGSLEYAEATLRDSLRLAVVLGHTGCGAVTAAVDTYLDPRTYPDVPSLRSVVDRILPAVRAADQALASVDAYGHAAAATARQALIETSVVLNAALSASTIRDDLETLVVRFGVFDLVTRCASIEVPPSGTDGFVELASDVVHRPSIRALLDA